MGLFLKWTQNRGARSEGLVKGVLPGKTGKGGVEQVASGEEARQGGVAGEVPRSARSQGSSEV